MVNIYDENTIKRFWDKVDIKGLDDCWPWLGSTNKRGQGKFYIGFEDLYAHRMAYLFGVGPIPESENKHSGICVHQTCGNKLCCNPKHLFLGHRRASINDIHKDERRRFYENTIIGEGDDCWIWIGWFTRKGYGMIRVNGRSIMAHRLSWELHYGPIPEDDSYHGICVCHKCDNPACVRPDHLFLGTNHDNVLDKMAKGRHGFVEGAEHPHAKLTEEQVIQILTDKSHTGAEYARLFNMGETAIYEVINGHTWKSVNKKLKAEGRI